MPLYDIFGSTIELVDAANPGSPITNYYYDPGGEVTTTPNNVRTPWPFLYHGLEQEYPDSWKLYWEPGGNVYNPDPFQLSLTGPQGLGGVSSFPRGVAPMGNTSGDYGSAQRDDSIAAAAVLAAPLPWDACPGCAFFALEAYAFFDQLFSGDSKPTIPWYVTTHKSRGAHDVYCGVQGICGAIVTQQGQITLAEDDEEDGGDPGIDSEREGQAGRDITESEQAQAPSNAAPAASPADFQSTLDRIFRGDSFPHRNDGAVFENDAGLLPAKPQGYYHEYVHPTPGISHAGLQRLIIGQDGGVYYTPDHYKTFIRLR